MGDIKLFRIDGQNVFELEGQSIAIEKSLQTLIEKHLEAFLGVRFLASEYSTGKTHGGRIDTLGIDENNCPVIIEYKRALNENVINQGLFYLDWLMDHKAEFTLIVLKRFGEKAADAIEWPSPRLLCIAGDFTKYDEHAVQQINRNIELMRYKRYGSDLIIFELVNAVTSQVVSENGEHMGKKAKTDKTVSYYLSRANDEIKDRYEAIKVFLLALGDDVQVKELKNYIAFKRLRNFACIEFSPQAGKIYAYIRVSPDTVDTVEGFTRDVRNIGHWGTGDLEITIMSDEEFERAKPLLAKSYEIN